MNAGYLRVAVALWFVALVAGGYAESFPNRPALADMSEYAAQGIICGNAVRERELAVNRSRSFLPYCGVWQPYIVSLQSEIEYLAPSYIDHENGPLTDAGDEFLYFTLDNWRAAAGLNASGFRRSVDGTTILYGQMQPGDIIGPWVFEDLQNGLNKLKWTKTGGTYVYPAMEKKVLKWVRYYPGPNLAGFIAAYSATPWVGASFGECSGYKISGGWSGPDWLGWYYTESTRYRGRQTLGFPTINRKVDIYIRTRADAGWFDYDNTGLVQGKYTLYRSDPETSDTTVVLDYISNIATCPLAINEGSHSISSDNWIYYLIKWQFTYGEE